MKDFTFADFSKAQRKPNISMWPEPDGYRKILADHAPAWAHNVPGHNGKGLINHQAGWRDGMNSTSRNGASGQGSPAKTLTKHATHFIAFALFKVLLALAFIGGCYAG